MRREDRLVVSSANDNLNNWRSQESGSSEYSVDDATEVEVQRKAREGDHSGAGSFFLLTRGT